MGEGRRYYSEAEEHNRLSESRSDCLRGYEENREEPYSRGRAYHQAISEDGEEKYEEECGRRIENDADTSNEGYNLTVNSRRNRLRKPKKNSGGRSERNYTRYQLAEDDEIADETMKDLRDRSFARDTMGETADQEADELEKNAVVEKNRANDPVCREFFEEEDTRKALKNEGDMPNKEVLENELADKTKSKGNAYSYALELMGVFDFEMADGQLHTYCEGEGSWRFLSNAEENRGLRALVPEEMRRYINRNTLAEMYEWLRTCANEMKEDSASIYFLNFKDAAYDWKNRNVERSRKKYGFRYVLQAKISALKMPGNGKYDKFVHDIFGNDEATIREFHKFIGLCLSDIRYLKLCFFLFGPSNTGKSVILNILKILIGDEWSASLSFAQMGNEFAITQLLGKRINLSGEVSGTSNKRLDIFKSLTGNDKVTACYKGKDHFQFYNRCLLVFACNSFPHVDVVEEFESFLSRVIIFPFANVKPREEWIEGLERQIIEEDAGSILRKAIEGLRCLEKDNFCFLETEAMKACKRDFQGSVNSFALFAAELLERNTESALASEEITIRYKSYCRENELQELAPNIWGPYLQQVYGCRRRIIEEMDGSRKQRRRAYQGVKFIEKC